MACLYSILQFFKEKKYLLEDKILQICALLQSQQLK